MAKLIHHPKGKTYHYDTIEIALEHAEDCEEQSDGALVYERTGKNTVEVREPKQQGTGDD